MADFNSKYTGEQVEEFLDKIANGEIGGGGITTETDPIFSASPAASITTEKISAWDDKEDKPIVFDADKAGIEIGDGSEEAPGTFTPEQFQLATGMTFAELREEVSSGRKVVMRALQKVLEQEAAEVDESSLDITFTMYGGQVGLFLHCDSTNRSLVIIGVAEQFTELFYTKEEIDTNKQDKITDLDAIRSGAEKGATALQSIPSEYITALNDKVDKVDGKQLSTEDFTSALKTKLEGLSNYDDTEIENAITSLQTQFNTLVSGNASDAINSFNEIIAFLDGVKDTEDLSSIIASIEQQIAGKMDKVTLAKVATSGSYNDLSNKPTIPSAVTESTVSGWGFTKNTGTYSKPSGGIPKSDMASDVQASLSKADTALQSYTEQYKGTVTGVKINGTTKNPSSGVVDLGTVITSHQDIRGKQDKLVSGTNIKTINGTSILGSGNIVISGGGGSSSGNGAYAEVNHGTSDTNFTLTPNTFHVWDEVASLSLDFGSETSGVANEYLFQFTSGATATSLTLPDDIKWANDAVPTITENMIYQVSILKGMASVLEFDNAPSVTLINFAIRTIFCNAIEGMTWEQWVSSEYNTANCSLMGNNVQRYGEMIGTSYTSPVIKTDVINNGFTYITIPAT